MAENETALAEPTAPEPAPQPAAEQPERSDTEKVVEQRVVPLAELQRERERRKEVEARTAKLEDRLTQLFQVANRQPEREEPKIPDIQADPVEHFRVKQERLEQTQSQLVRELQQRQQVEQQRTQQEQFVARYKAAAGEFVEKQQDFGEAYKHLAKMRDEELRLAGWTDPVERERRLNLEEQAIVFQAFRDNANPAERLYALAKHRGYKPSTETDGEKLDTIAAGQKSSKSLSGAGGGAPAGRVSLSQLAEMTDEEFAKATRGDNWRKLMGG